MPRYFAYGSNLDPVQMTRRCVRIERVGPTHLSDHRLVFAGASKNWGGAGVATIIAAPDHAVYGFLYDLDAEALAQLDRYEGSYDRRRITVAAGEAYTYVRREATPLRAPSPEYLAIMAQAYVVHDHPLSVLIAALSS